VICALKHRAGKYWKPAAQKRLKQLGFEGCIEVYSKMMMEKTFIPGR
jgi:hypothetical protein